jgi:hypothetical protein
VEDLPLAWIAAGRQLLPSVNLPLTINGQLGREFNCERFMRIQATGTAALAPNAAAPRRGAREAFRVADDGPARAGSAGGPRAVASLDALIALQSVEDSTERRRRSVRRGQTALDALDELKLGLLAGALDAGALARLENLSAGLGEASGDAGLDGVMAEIRLRAAVERAKFSRP